MNFLGNKRVSIIIPTYNERENVAQLTGRIHQTFTDHGLKDYELIFIDDHSPDGTFELIRGLDKEFSIRAYRKVGKRGKAYSLLEGFSYANGDIFVMIDADLQYPPEAIPEMIGRLTDHDIIIANRKVQHVQPHRRVLSQVYAYVFGKLLLGLSVDIQSGLKVFKRQVLNHLTLNPTQWGFDYEFLYLAKRQGYSLGEVDIIFGKRMHGQSNVTYLLTGAELAWGALRLRARHLFSRSVRNAPQVTDRTVPLPLQAPISISPSSFTPAFLQNEPVIPFGPELQRKKGRGFFFKDQEFIHHTALGHDQTAFYNLVGKQRFWLLLGCGFLIASLILSWHTTLLVIFSLLTTLYFLDLLFNLFLIYKSFQLQPEITISSEQLAKKQHWPSYTIFCPLYKEWQVVNQFAQAMLALDYPKDKLQILFLLEEDDTQTIERVRQAKLPPHFSIVVVPHSMPKTKPKAMNYGLLYAKGEYVVVYDAEDMPEPDQLKKAVLAFETVDARTICIQAKLNYYNPKQNLLTRIFTAEYSLWFDLVLPGLQALHVPIPLGGTSNHFRLNDIKALNGWDAFNVTEDCDLGMRLAKQGFETAIINSTTFEEANSSLKNWFSQRSRWIKGYIQTYLVHMRTPGEFLQVAKRHFVAFQLVVGGKILSMFINPLMWAITASYFLFRAQIGTFIESFFPGPILYIGVTSFIIGNFLYLYYYMIGCAKRGHDDIIKYVFLVPFYWLAMSVAAWKAVYEIIVKPHYWAKTLHGLHLGTSVSQEKPLDLEPVKLPAATQAMQASGIPLSVISHGGVLVGSLLVANVLNFLFNAFLGRALSLEDFGLLSVLNTLAYLAGIFIGALDTTVNHRTAYVSSKYGPATGVSFLEQMRSRNWFSFMIMTLFWVAATPLIAVFFHIPDLNILLAFTPVITLGLFTALNRGFLQGNLNFVAIGISVVIEAASKLLFAILLVEFGIPQLVALAIPLAAVTVFFASWQLARWQVYTIKQQEMEERKAPFAFSRRFFVAALLTGLSSALFLSLDVLLVKHYLSATEAGEYALLSLVGKMVFFFGSLLSGFIVTFVSRDEGQGKNPAETFYKIFLATIFLVSIAFIGLGPLGIISVPILLGTRAYAILPYLTSYAFAIALFTLANSIVVFHLGRRHYLFSFVALAMSGVLYSGIAFSHQSIAQVVDVLIAVNVFNLLLMGLLHLLQRNGRFILSNIIDLLNVFHPLPPLSDMAKGKRVLIFNWRDTKHTMAGGAEIYIHELAKRWAAQGHMVTLFCGNDGASKRNDYIDGVHIVRRGGFYLVYFWAFVYYVVRFRGRFDVIIDCENGIPFFTPLYAKEPVFCLLHHVHQDVFRKYLNPPMAMLASTLENRLMPFAYRNTKFITISPSSQREMRQLDLTGQSIDIVYPGVNLTSLRPGKKAAQPTVLYLGRLKAYKSVDVLLRAFAAIIKRMPSARLVIAGSGEEEVNLKQLAQQLNLSETVEFTGKVSEQEKVSLLQQAWVFVNPSYMEGWGITTIEANACATPVVAANVPGLRDSVNNPHTGFLVPHGDDKAFAQKILLLLTNNGLRYVMGRQAVIWAKQFDWEKSAQKSVQLLNLQQTTDN